MMFLLFGGIFMMSSQDLQSDQTSHSYWMDKVKTTNSKPISPDELRKKILEEDRKKRRRIVTISCLILAFIVAIMSLLALKHNLIKDPSLINNMDLLLNSEEISFYNKMEFYKWLELAVAEQGQ